MDSVILDGCSRQRGESYSKLYTLIIVLFPILQQYNVGIGGVFLADLCTIFGIFLLLLKKTKIKYNLIISCIVFSFVCGIFTTFISLGLQNSHNFEAYSRLIRWGFYVAVIIANYSFFDNKYGIAVYKKIAYWIALYMIVQFVVFALFKKIMPVKILPLKFARDMTYLEELGLQYYFRACGLFSEPGYAVLYIYPAIVMNLYDIKKRGWNRKCLISTVVILIALIITVSMQALVIILTIGIGFIITNLKKIGKYLIVILVLMLIAVYAFINLGIYDILRSRIDTITSPKPGSSIALRVYRGFDLYSRVPTIYKIIGLGHGNIKDYCINNSLKSYYDSKKMTDLEYDYVNGIASILLYYGIAGMALVSITSFLIYRRLNKMSKFLLLVFIVTNFGEGCMFNYITMFHISLILSGIKEKNL